jgi:hypothetical protein
MQDVRFTFNDLVIFFAIINTLLGILFGIFPLVVGLKNANRKYAVIGFIASIGGGFLLSIILAFPIALIFTILSLRKASIPIDGAEPSPSV